MEEYRKIVKVPPTLLFQEDLLELENKVIQSFDCSKVDIKVTVCFETHSIEANSVTSILTDIKKDYTNEFELNAFGRNAEGDIIRSLTVRMFHSFVDYQIAGNNEIWFMGMIRMLDSFFQSRKPWYSLIKKIFPFITGILVAPLLFLIMTGIKMSSYLLTTLSFTFLILLFIIMYLGINEKILPYVRIYFTLRNEKKITHQTIITIVSVLTLIITLIGSIIIPFIVK